MKDMPEMRPCQRCGTYGTLAELDPVREGAWVRWECRDKAKCGRRVAESGGKDADKD